MIGQEKLRNIIQAHELSDDIKKLHAVLHIKEQESNRILSLLDSDIRQLKQHKIKLEIIQTNQTIFVASQRELEILTRFFCNLPVQCVKFRTQIAINLIGLKKAFKNSIRSLEKIREQTRTPVNQDLQVTRISFYKQLQLLTAFSPAQLRGIFTAFNYPRNLHLSEESKIVSELNNQDHLFVNMMTESSKLFFDFWQIILESQKSAHLADELRLPQTEFDTLLKIEQNEFSRYIQQEKQCIIDVLAPKKAEVIKQHKITVNEAISKQLYQLVNPPAVSLKKDTTEPENDIENQILMFQQFYKLQESEIAYCNTVLSTTSYKQKMAYLKTLKDIQQTQDIFVECWTSFKNCQTEFNETVHLSSAGVMWKFFEVQQKIVAVAQIVFQLQKLVGYPCDLMLEPMRMFEYLSQNISANMCLKVVKAIMTPVEAQEKKLSKILKKGINKLQICLNMDLDDERLQNLSHIVWNQIDQVFGEHTFDSNLNNAVKTEEKRLLVLNIIKMKAFLFKAQVCTIAPLRIGKIEIFKQFEMNKKMYYEQMTAGQCGNYMEDKYLKYIDDAPPEMQRFTFYDLVRQNKPRPWRIQNNIQMIGTGVEIKEKPVDVEDKPVKDWRLTQSVFNDLEKLADICLRGLYYDRYDMDQDVVLQQQIELIGKPKSVLLPKAEIQEDSDIKEDLDYIENQAKFEVAKINRLEQVEQYKKQVQQWQQNLIQTKQENLKRGAIDVGV